MCYDGPKGALPFDREAYVPYCGLVPGTHRPDGTEQREGLPPHGNGYLKRVYSHATPRAVAHPYLRRTHRREVRKNRKMIPCLTFRRQLSICHYHMLAMEEDLLANRGG